MAQRLIPALEQTINSSDVTIGVGYQLYTYTTGTTTLATTYSDEALTTANTNPIVADANGSFGDVWVSDLSLYKIALYDADSVLVSTFDPVDGQSNSLTDFDPMPTVYMGTTSGDGSTYTLTSDVGLTEYVNTQSFLITFHVTNNASPSINIDGLGAVGLYYYADDGTPTALPADTINTAQTYLLNWNDDGTELIITILQSKTITASTSTQGIAYLSSFITITNNSSNSTYAIDFSEGVFNFADGSGQATLSALTKNINSSWTAGSGNGGLFTGTVAPSTWYHCWAIYNPTTGVSDAGFDVTGFVIPSNIPSGYTKYSYRGSILTDSSSNIVGFHQVGNRFDWNLPFNEYNSTSSPSSLTFVSTTVPPNISLIGIYGIACTSISNQLAYMRLMYPGATDATPTNSNSQFQCQGSSGNFTLSSTYVEVPTDTNSTIGFRSSNSAVGAILNTFGYIIPSNILY